MKEKVLQTGHGVVNYTTNNSGTSYAFTDPYQTTEFDDELIRRGIVSYEQAIIAKGATPHDARRLHLKKIELEKPPTAKEIESNITQNNNSSIEEDDDNDDSLDDDEYFKDFAHENDDEKDEFLTQYRSKRLLELKQQQKIADNTNTKSNSQFLFYGNVIKIQKLNWKQEINESSLKCTVVVHFSYPYGQEADERIRNLAEKYPMLKFVSIDYLDAVANYPTQNLPTIFVYQDGKLAFQEIRYQLCNLENLFRKWGIIDIKQYYSEEESKEVTNSNGLVFGGMISNFATKINLDSDEDDDDDDDLDDFD